MASDDSQPSTPVHDVAAEGVSPVSSRVVSSPASSSMSPDVSSFLQQLRQARSDNPEDIHSKMIKQRAERDEAKLKAKQVAKDLKRLRNARTLKKTKLASAEELLEALAARAESAEKKKVAAAAAVARASTP